MSWFRRRLKGWRTVAFGLLVTLLGVLEAVQAIDLSALFGDHYGVAMAVIGLTTIALRMITTGPMGSQPAAEPDWEDGAP